MSHRLGLPIVSEETPAARARDTSRPIVLVGFLHQGNLGLGYLTSTLEQHGYRVVVIDFEAEREAITRTVLAAEPLIVGFSLIFQFYLPRFAALIEHLRSVGVDAHFTMGGHFPTLSPEETFANLPGLDSVVRYEGELTLLALADHLGTRRAWRDLDGIAYADGERIVRNRDRRLLDDLDALPWPNRGFEPETVLGHPAMPLLASRGCARTCSVCSIHTFYRSAPGKVVRTRKPTRVVDEMRALHQERDISIFLFQDDDFPLFGPAWKRWTRDLLRELRSAELTDRIIWKISCRADAVDEVLFREMKAAGLYLVYMGLESGTEDGLDTLNKQITVEQNLRAVDTLKRLGLMVEFGFMLFDPSSTFASIRENLAFLDTITRDGSAAAVFCRMLPYYGTPIRDELARTGRLRGDVCNPDYTFLDPRIEDFYATVNRLMNITGWIHGYRALSPQLNWAHNEVAILERLFPELPDLDAYREELRSITRESNRLLLDTVEALSNVFSGDLAAMPPDPARLASACSDFLRRLLERRNAFFGRHERTLGASLESRGLAKAPAPAEPEAVLAH